MKKKILQACVPALFAVSFGSAAETSPLKVMALGDSITEGYCINDAPNSGAQHCGTESYTELQGSDIAACRFKEIKERNLGGYRVPFQAKALQRGWNFQYLGSRGLGSVGAVAHMGFPGWQIPFLTRCVQGWMATQGMPDIILLQAGTNDAIKMPNATPASVTATMRELLLKIAALSVGRRPRILLGELLPIQTYRTAPPFDEAGQPPTVAESIRTGYNALLPGLAAEISANTNLTVTVVKMSGITLADLSDGVHPNAVGYAKMADAWIAALTGSAAGLIPVN